MADRRMDGSKDGEVPAWRKAYLVRFFFGVSVTMSQNRPCHQFFFFLHDSSVYQIKVCEGLKIFVRIICQLLNNFSKLGGWTLVVTF